MTTPALLAVLLISLSMVLWRDLTRFEIHFEALGSASLVILMSAGAALEALGCAALLGLVCEGLRRLRPGQIGAGDPWAFAALGLAAGPHAAPVILLVFTALSLLAALAYSHARGKPPFRSMFPVALALVPAMALAVALRLPEHQGLWGVASTLTLGLVIFMGCRRSAAAKRPRFTRTGARGLVNVRGLQHVRPGRAASKDVTQFLERFQFPLSRLFARCAHTQRTARHISIKPRSALTHVRTKRLRCASNARISMGRGNAVGFRGCAVGRPDCCSNATDVESDNLCYVKYDSNTDLYTNQIQRQITPSIPSEGTGRCTPLPRSTCLRGCRPDHTNSPPELQQSQHLSSGRPRFCARAYVQQYIPEAPHDRLFCSHVPQQDAIQAGSANDTIGYWSKGANGGVLASQYGVPADNLPQKLHPPKARGSHPLFSPMERPGVQSEVLAGTYRESRCRTRVEEDAAKPSETCFDPSIRASASYWPQESIEARGTNSAEIWLASLSHITSENSRFPPTSPVPSGDDIRATAMFETFETGEGFCANDPAMPASGVSATCAEDRKTVPDVGNTGVDVPARTSLSVAPDSTALGNTLEHVPVRMRLSSIRDTSNTQLSMIGGRTL